MIHFTPGPSHIASTTKEALIQLVQGDSLSDSHRGDAFKESFHTLRQRFCQVFEAPDEVEVFFFPSSTAVMHAILANWRPSHPLHLIQGAFAQRFFDTSKQLGLKAHAIEFAWDQPIPLPLESSASEMDFLAITHNETSTGLQWPDFALRRLRLEYPQTLIALDMTSSFGAIEVPWDQVDLVFGSVQKALGCPAGLGFLFANKRSLNQLKDVDLPDWFRLSHLRQAYLKAQPVETPNMLAMLLLIRVLSSWQTQETYAKIQRHFQDFLQPLEKDASFFVSNPEWQSRTIVNLRVPDPLAVRAFFHQRGLVLGAGYGRLANSHVRLANFPAHEAPDFHRLLDVWHDAHHHHLFGP
jgi:phosphoserine aminotransferase